MWVAREQALYWVDIKGLKIFRLCPEGKVSGWDTPFRIGSLAPRRTGGFVAGTERGFAWIDLEACRYDLFANPETDLPDNRFNDGKVDRSGRFWAGTMDDQERQSSGALYRLDPNLAWTRIDDGYRVTNGPAFSADGRRMYHNDSGRQLTYVFDLNRSGEPSGRRVFASYGPGQGYPDGMTVDREDCLWIAYTLPRQASASSLPNSPRNLVRAICLCSTRAAPESPTCHSPANFFQIAPRSTGHRQLHVRDRNRKQHSHYQRRPDPDRPDGCLWALHPLAP